MKPANSLSIIECDHFPASEEKVLSQLIEVNS
jgi:hypothetical protein